MLALLDERREKEKDNAPRGSAGKLVASEGLREKNEDVRGRERASSRMGRGCGLAADVHGECYRKS
jgi:hypothetical protein